MTIDIILDLFVIICLGATIAFAIRLNNRLTMLYKSRDEMQAFLTQFSESMEKADAGIKDLRGIGESVFKTAQSQLKTAEALKADLGFLNERGEEIAQKLDSVISEARTHLKSVEDMSHSPASFNTVKKQVPTTPMAANTATSLDNTSAAPSEKSALHHLQNVR